MKNDNKNKKISVIIPIYKVEKYLDRCLESVTNQTYKNLEIILVDDGSPDASPEICDKWAKKDNRIKVFHKPNGGVSSARNLGIENATGDYLTFIDSDDTIELETYEKCVAKLNDEVDTVFFRMKNIFLDGSTWDNYEINLKDIINNKNFICPFYYKKGRKNSNENVNVMGSCARVVFNAKVIKENNLTFNQTLFNQEDKDFLLRYLLLCKKLDLVDEYLYNYYIYQNSAKAMNSFYFKIPTNFKNLLECESKTLYKNPFLTKSQIETIIKSCGIDYSNFVMLKFIEAGAPKEDIKKLYKNKDYKYLLNKGGIFFKNKNYTRKKSFAIFILIKLHMIKLLKFLTNKKK